MSPVFHSEEISGGFAEATYCCIYKFLAIHREAYGKEKKAGGHFGMRRRTHCIVFSREDSQIRLAEARLPPSTWNENAREVAGKSEKWLQTVNLNEQISAALDKHWSMSESKSLLNQALLPGLVNTTGRDLGKQVSLCSVCWVKNTVLNPPILFINPNPDIKH